jgi:hypothetical protein
MTNWEKFKEVFGFPESDIVMPVGSMCEIIECDDIQCYDCPICENDVCVKSFWNREYNEKGRKE